MEDKKFLEKQENIYWKSNFLDKNGIGNCTVVNGD